MSCEPWPSLALYAAISAHIVHFRGTAPEEVVAALGVDPTKWRAAHAHWTGELAAAFVDDDLTAVDEFSVGFADAAARLAELRPSLETLERIEEDCSTESTADAVVSAADPLPFRPGAWVVPPASIRPPPPRSPSASDEETLTVPTGRAWGGAPLPFIHAEDDERSRDARVPDLGLEQYASLCAELTTAPEGRSRILSTYGIDGDAGHRLLLRHWRRRLDAHPEERARWAELYQSFVRWLRRDRGFGA